jgi:hypothetical protein
LVWPPVTVKPGGFSVVSQFENRRQREGRYSIT